MAVLPRIQPEELAEPWSRDGAVALYIENKSAGAPPDLPGVYGLWCGDECLYIGRSRNLYQRLVRWHEKLRECPYAHPEWAVCPNFWEVERWLIQGMNPERNIGHGRRRYQKVVRKPLVPRDIFGMRYEAH